MTGDREIVMLHKILLLRMFASLPPQKTVLRSSKIAKKTRFAGKWPASRVALAVRPSVRPSVRPRSVRPSVRPSDANALGFVWVSFPRAISEGFSLCELTAGVELHAARGEVMRL